MQSFPRRTESRDGMVSCNYRQFLRGECRGDRQNYTQLQAIFTRRMPRRPTELLKEDGNLTRGPTEEKQRW